MALSKRTFKLALPALALLMSATLLQADPGDTTTVVTFVEENHNNGSGGRTNEGTFTFPDGSVDYSLVTMVYTQSCPPGGCDPWDRLGTLSVVQMIDDTTESVIEIGRIITPYDISGSGPGTCDWEFDVTDYLPILRGEVRLRSFISSWIGDPRGWECTVVFHFIEGELEMRPFRVVNLWNEEYVVYGDPDRPPEDLLDEVIVDIDEITEMAVLRIVTTGHGQGNTHNAAEFSRKDHGVWIGFENFEHELWRDNCEHNPCSPQGGTWQYDRAGWCPGDRVYPWDLSGFQFTPGQSLNIWPYFEQFENLCRPNNPDCTPGVTCPDCEYNSTGHTEPNYSTTGQLLLWSSQTSPAEPSEPPIVSGFTLGQNFPNPFNPKTTIPFSVSRRSHLSITVYNVLGERVMTLFDGIALKGNHSVPFDGSRLGNGVYFYTLRSGATMLTEKMLLLK